MVPPCVLSMSQPSQPCTADCQTAAALAAISCTPPLTPSHALGGDNLKIPNNACSKQLRHGSVREAWQAGEAVTATPPLRPTPLCQACQPTFSPVTVSTPMPASARPAATAVAMPAPVPLARQSRTTALGVPPSLACRLPPCTQSAGEHCLPGGWQWPRAGAMN